MKNYTDQEWMQLQERMKRKVTLCKDFPYSCLLFEKGELVCIGISTDNIQDAIKNCRERFGLQNLRKMLDKHVTSEQQKANLKAAKKLTGI